MPDRGQWGVSKRHRGRDSSLAPGRGAPAAALRPPERPSRVACANTWRTRRREWP
ncbi:hypothetical protein EVAR_72912_1, partial [Eumeta japonica]